MAKSFLHYVMASKEIEGGSRRHNERVKWASKDHQMSINKASGKNQKGIKDGVSDSIKMTLRRCQRGIRGHRRNIKVASKEYQLSIKRASKRY